MQAKIAEFSAWHGWHAEFVPRQRFDAHWHAESVDSMQIQPIRKKFTEVFGYEPNGKTIVRMIVRDNLHVLPDGWAMHGMGPQIPDYVVHAINLCHVETKIVSAGTIPGNNFPPDLQVRVWKV